MIYTTFGEDYKILYIINVLSVLLIMQLIIAWQPSTFVFQRIFFVYIGH